MQAVWRDIGFRARLALMLAAAAAAALLLVGLLGGSPAPAKGAATASGSVTVTMEHFEYHPRTIHVAKGTRVVFFNNQQHTKHTATRNGSFNTGVIKPGASVAVRFTAPGTYAYHCTIHKGMRGKIIVG